jgi:hypothetical protein
MDQPAVHLPEDRDLERALDANAQSASGDGAVSRGGLAPTRSTTQIAQSESQQEIRRAATARLARVPSLSPVFSGLPNLLNLSGSGASIVSGPESSVVRQWGNLRPRDPNQLNAPREEETPPGYQEALKAYFDALNQTGSSK